jgi:uncharacterized Tic20 family protein
MNETVATSDERQLGMLAHLLGALIGAFMPFFGGVIAPLIIFVTRRESSPFVAQHARAALNFQITVMLATIACYCVFFSIWLSVMPAFFAHLPRTPQASPELPPGFRGMFFAMFVFMAVQFGIIITNVVFGALGSVAASQGKTYRYPVSLRLVR